MRAIPKIIAGLALCFALAMTGVLAACGSCGASDRKAEPTPSADAGYEAWGARFELPASWSGGQNEGGGFEFTDGEIALLVGHHALEEGRSLDDFLEERRRALVSEVGEIEEVSRSERKLHEKRALAFFGRASVEGGRIDVRLLVAPLGAREALSLMMVSDSAGSARLDPVWNRVIDSLRLP